jgi:VWFA-related protein
MSLASPLAAQEPFRARTEVVAVDVLVRLANAPVTNLTAGDFELRDNGVVQQVDVISADRVPVDLTLVLDMSFSARFLVDRFKDDVRQIAELLRRDDRVRLLAFGSTTVEVFGFQPGNAPLSFERLQPLGVTALDDALILALAWVPEPRRRHLVAVFTDGLDNQSLIERRDLLVAATRAPALLYAAMPRPIAGTNAKASGSYLSEGGDTLRTAAESTGGGLIISERSSRVLDGFKTVFETFRSGYVLHYTPRGVERSGWHELSVTVKRAGKYEVHARKGYSGG